MSQAPTEILLLESNPANLALMRDMLEQSGFRIAAADTPAGIEEALRSVPHCRTALLDSSGFGTDFWDACKLLHSHHIPFVVVFPQVTNPKRHADLSHGASAVLSKPLTRQQLLSVLRALTEE
jgi:CheY-like chemotaxis protein